MVHLISGTQIQSHQPKDNLSNMWVYTIVYARKEGSGSPIPSLFTPRDHFGNARPPVQQCQRVMGESWMVCPSAFLSAADLFKSQTGGPKSSIGQEWTAN